MDDIITTFIEQSLEKTNEETEYTSMKIVWLMFMKWYKNLYSHMPLPPRTELKKGLEKKIVIKNSKLVGWIPAVHQNGMLLEHITTQTPEICLAAVQQNGLALEYVQVQTPEICLAAVQQNGWALKHVKEQTPEICIAAVQENGWALQCVKEQTPEICLAAVQNWDLALHCVKDLQLRAELEFYLEHGFMPGTKTKSARKKN